MAMRITPRDYQEFASISVFNFFRDHGAESKHPIVAMPTGTGKSVVIADLLYKILSMWCNQRILVLTHVKELIEQNYAKFVAMWPEAPAGVYSAGLGRRDVHHNVIFGGIASVFKQMHAFGRFDLVFVDECHLVNPEDEGMYRKLFEYLRSLNPHLKIVGFTATPWRLGHGSLVENGIFTDICCDMTGVEAFNWLIAQGYLMPLVPKKTGTKLDVDGVHMQGGDFKNKELQTAVDKDHITRAALQEAIELGEDRRHWLVFAAGVEHACHIADMLTYEFGIPAVAIHGKLNKTDRDEAIRKFKVGEYRVAVNNNVLTTGFDFPGIDLILMLRPTASAVLWVQMLGRGTRPDYAQGYDLSTQEGRIAAIAASNKQNCLVLDFAGNTRRLGPINDPLVPKKKGEKVGQAPVKECVCGAYVHASARFCGGKPKDHPEFNPAAGCGYEFEITTKLKQAASTEALIKGDMPVVEVFAVDQVTIQRYAKNDIGMAKVTYYCGLKMFTEYMGIDHPMHNMRAKARDWWKQRAGAGAVLPTTTDEFLTGANNLPPATHIRVWTNQKYPSVLAYCFDGTAFGTQDASSKRPTVQVDSIGQTVKRGSFARVAKQATQQDADIPFHQHEYVAKIRTGEINPLEGDIPF